MSVKQGSGVCAILKLLYSNMLIANQKIRKVWTSLRRIASQSFGVKQRTRLGVQKKKKKMFKGVGASRGIE